MNASVFEMNGKGGFSPVSTAAGASVKVGDVLRWGGNAAWPQTDYCVLEVVPGGAFGGYLELYDLDNPERNATLHRAEFHSIKRRDDPGVWHSQHYFLTDETRTPAEVEGYRAEYTRQAARRKAGAAEAARLDAELLGRGRTAFARLWPEGAAFAIVAESMVDDSDIQTDYFAEHAETALLLAPSRSKRDNFTEMRKAAALLPETAHLGPGKGDFAAVIVCAADGRDDQGRALYAGTPSGWHHDERREFDERAAAEAYAAATPIDPPELRFAGGSVIPLKWDIREEDCEHREKWSMGKGYYLQRRGNPWRVRKTNALNADGTPTDTLLRLLGGNVAHLERTAATAPGKSGAVAADTAEGAIWRLNAERGGVEIVFPSKPDESVLAELKADGWRWSRAGGCWYTKDTESSRAAAARLTGQQTEG